MDLLCPYDWSWICRAGNIHLSTGDKPRHHPRAEGKEITKRNGKSKSSFCFGIPRHRTTTPHLVTQTTLQTPRIISHRLVPFNINGHQLRILVPLFHDVSHRVSGSL